MSKTKALSAIKKDIKKFKPTAKMEAKPLVHAILCQALGPDVDETAALVLIQKLQDSYHNWNEIRVSRPYHVADEIGAKGEEIDQVMCIIETLHRVFTTFGDLTENIFEGKPDSDIRKSLEKLLGKERDSATVVMVQAMNKVEMPLSARVYAMFKEYGYIDETTTRRQLQKEITEVIGAKELFAFYDGVEQLAASRVAVA